MRKIFITGTDTNCGKTYTTIKLLEFFKQQGKRVLAIKPVATGGILQHQQLINEDEKLLQDAQKLTIDLTYKKYPTPVSPHIAAKLQNQNIELEDLLEFCENFQPMTDILLIEGAGGLLVPLNDSETWLDFLKLANAECIFVIALRLGCLNHGLLTDYVLKTNRIKTLGWIANCMDKNVLHLDENISTLQNKLYSSFIGKIHYNSTFKFDAELLL